MKPSLIPSDASLLGVMLEENRAFRNEMNIQIQSLRLEIRASLDRANSAHEEIAKYRNRFYGWLAGIGGGGVTIGVSCADGIKNLAKALL